MACLVEVRDTPCGTPAQDGYDTGVRNTALAAGLLALAGLAATGCDDAGAGAPHVRTYVALGDSYTAGSGTGPNVDGSGAGCGQARRSYPRLVAAALGARLKDASCAGAMTGNAFANQTVNGDQVWPAQLNLVDRDADLVTVGFGYNDLGFLVDALVACDSSVAGSPIATVCPASGRHTDTDPAVLAAEIGDRLERVLEQVEQRAPDALVLVVGYPQPIPAHGECTQLSLVQGGYDSARDAFERLDDAMRKAAKDAGATFVDVFGASEGHDICAGDSAWVNGSEGLDGVALPFHPYQREQDAVATLVEDAAAAS
jgi:lysophospholipase L1-like esterase